MNNVEIELSKPITAHGETLSRLVLREPVAGDLRDFPMGLEKIPFSAFLDIAARISGVPPSSINQLSARDALRVAGVISGFLDVTAPAGGTPPS
ncbi:MAG: phage tail assembly protein [Candidatus Accumulibacter sp.]|jgi:hypothetical protein|nr:phage tail assembly protein [Accumulibacter sp.]